MPNNRRLDVSVDSPDEDVAAKRREFDAHLDSCMSCTPFLCPKANTIWREVVFAALRSRGGQ